MLRTGGRGVPAAASGGTGASDPRRRTAPATAANRPAASLRFAILPFAVALARRGYHSNPPPQGPPRGTLRDVNLTRAAQLVADGCGPPRGTRILHVTDLHNRPAAFRLASAPPPAVAFGLGGTHRR